MDGAPHTPTTGRSAGADPGRPDRLERLRAQLDQGDRAHQSARSRWLDPVRRLAPNAVPRARTTMTAALRPVAERKLRELREQRPLRLHLGSGFEYKAGWINLDLAPLKVDVPWNLANGIPFEPGTVEAILHEHLLEHLTLAQGHGLMRECVRVLEPGGVLRIGVPDAGACLDSYAGLADQDWAESQPTPMVAVMSLFYEHGHACMYDAETLELLCLASGFASAKRSDAGGGTLGADDTPSRRDGTLYVEAVR